MKHVERGLRFGASGGAVFLVDLGLVWLLREALPPLVAVSIAYAIAVGTHFWLNRSWVFSSREENLVSQGGRYALAVGCSWLATVLLVWAALRWITPHLLVAKAIAIPPVAVLGYFLMQGFVFKTRARQG